MLIVSVLLAILVGANYLINVWIGTEWLDRLRTLIFRGIFSASTQFAVAVCLLFYTCLLIINETKRSGLTKEMALELVFLGGVSVPYFTDYQTASQSYHVPALLGGIFLRRLAISWLACRDAGQRVAEVAICLVCFLVAGCAYGIWNSSKYQYHGISRWTGIWENPNKFGALMALGLTLSVGWALLWRMKKPARTSNFTRLNRMLLCLLAAVIVLGIGLFKSYSRGAWIASAVGFCFLVIAFRKTSVFWLTKAKAMLLVTLALFCIAGYSFRSSLPDSRFLSRVYSAVNPNDFSVRNRLIAYKGTFQAVCEHPWLGWGWSKGAKVIQHYYAPVSQEEASSPISTNDYCILFVETGAFGTGCFLMLVLSPLFSSLRRRVKAVERTAVCNCQVSSICHAGVFVLLTAFIFDGGLFITETAAPFWILLGFCEVDESRTNAGPGSVDLHRVTSEPQKA